MLFQTSTNAPRQKVQAIFKQAAQAAGIEVELKATVATVFFSADTGNPDTNSKFQADLQMFACAGAASRDPQRNRHRPVVDELDLHVGAELAGLHRAGGARARCAAPPRRARGRAPAARQPRNSAGCRPWCRQRA